jgi:hypothetical protein
LALMAVGRKGTSTSTEEAPMSNQTFTTTAGGTAAPNTEKAKQVAGEVGDQAKQVASEAKEQARQVAGDIKEQAREVLGEARTEFRQQAESGTKRAADGIRTLGSQIEALRDGRPDEAGPIAGYADQARRKIEEVATRLDQGGLDGMIADVSRFARRRPGLFLLACTGAGFAVARLARSQAGSAAEPSVASASRPVSLPPPGAPALPLGPDAGTTALA